MALLQKISLNQGNRLPAAAAAGWRRGIAMQAHHSRRRCQSGEMPMSRSGFFRQGFIQFDVPLLNGVFHQIRQAFHL